MGSTTLTRHGDSLCMELEEACDGGTTCILLDPATGIFYNGDFTLGGWLIIRTSDLQPIEVVWDEGPSDEDEAPYSDDTGLFQFRISINQDNDPYPYIQANHSLTKSTPKPTT